MAPCSIALSNGVLPKLSVATGLDPLQKDFFGCEPVLWFEDDFHVAQF